MSWMAHTDSKTGIFTFIPATLDTTDMIDVTKVGQLGRVFFDPKTGTYHDSAKYREQAIAEMEGKKASKQ